MGFLLRNILTQLFLPLPFFFILVTTAVLLLGLGKSHRVRKLGIYGFGSALLLLYLLATPITANLLVAPLERWAIAQSSVPGYMDASDSSKPIIVVLGSGTNQDAPISPIAMLSQTAIARVSEAAGMYHCLQHLNPVLLPTGGSLWGTTSISHLSAAALEYLGVPSQSIHAVSSGTTTDGEAQAIADLLEKNPLWSSAPIYLVSSASHLRRAVLLFRAYGMNPIGIPTDFYSLPVSGPGLFFPSAIGLQASQRAINEYLGFFVDFLTSR